MMFTTGRSIKTTSLSIFIALLFCCAIASAFEANDPLPSWHNGSAKRKILDFVAAVTNSRSPDYVPPDDRIAVFDQDGTLWVEHPLYTEVVFSIDYAKNNLGDQEWTRTQPFKSIFSGIIEDARNLTHAQIKELVAKTHTGMSIDQFHKNVKNWLSQALHPRFKRKYNDLTYLPMLELMRYLKQNQFQVYIVSGSGQEFTRSFAESTYGLPPSRIIGSAVATKYEIVDGRPELIKEAKLTILDDKQGKPEAINLIIGKRPIAAFGNSTGDRQMLEWTQSNLGRTLEMLVHHDDGVREYAYGPDTKVGTFSDELMKEADDRGWTVISMKNDWNRIFSFEQALNVQPCECVNAER